jgi:leucyl aminopeptidase
MLSLLPDFGGPTLHAIPGAPTDAALAGLGALLVLLPVDGQPGRLPEAARWQALHGRQPARHGDVRATTLAQASPCVAALGYCRANATPFEVLSVAGKLVRQALALHPQIRRLGIQVPTGTPARRRAWQEALFAAASAQAFALPTAKGSTPGTPAPVRLTRVDLFGSADVDLRRSQATAKAGNLVRHLTALPPNVLDAGGYRRALGTLARRHGLTLRWYTEAALEKLGAGAFLAVSRGNASRDAGIAHLSYRPKGRRTQKPDVALVGKGILFDTGGTNLKSHRSMLDMHTDMVGSAVALASIVALAEIKAPIAVDAWLAITENNIGPKAYRPQEVIRAANGTTIQVIHSDAEGRMVLADTLTLAARTKPGLMVDYATLTGACVHALTERLSGVFSNREAYAPVLTAAGAASGERVWPFPLDEDFDSDIESSTADVAQCAVEGKGDHILAARFLKRFVPDATPWVHVDLSSATRRGGLAHVPTEITGFGVRFTLSLLLDQTLPTP